MPVYPLAAGKQELSDTALRLSQVIEREVRRNSRAVWLQPSSPSFKRSSWGSQGGDSKTRRGRKKSAVVAALERQGSKVVVLERQGSKIMQSKVDASVSPHERRSVTTASTTFTSTTHASQPLRSTTRQRVWLLVDDPQSSELANYLSMTIFFFVIVSTVIFVAQTEEAFAVYADELNIVEVICAAVFTVELLVRVIACPSKLQFFREFTNWIDIAAIFPFYLERILEVDNAATFGAIRIVRLTRVARVLKMSRYSSAIQVFVQAITVSMKPLSMLIFLMSIAMIVFSSMIYFAEFTRDGCRSGGWIGDCSSADASPRFAASIAGAAAARAASSTDCICVDPNPYKSIASSFWWCIVTMSTVGYGDMTPVTLLGKMVGCASVLTGMIVLALPITVIGTNFQKVMKSVMQQTMKSNVEYLRGKRMLCRNEIEVILQRFHAVTEDIHLDVDDVINVYDEDNNGILEDEELRRFRDDLEILQNRFIRSQHHGGGSSGTPPPLSPSANAVDSSRSVQGPLNAAAWSLGDAALQPQRCQYSPVFAPVHHASTSAAVVRYWNGGAHVSEYHRHQDGRKQSSAAPAGPGSTGISTQQPSSDDASIPSLAHATATSSSTTPLQLPGVLIHSSDTSGADDSTSHAYGSSSAAVPPSPLPAGVESELFWFRMLEMQHAWEERLHETETRLEAKLQLLTKVLVRMEGKFEDDDD